ncbi:glucosyltransferase [Chytridiales sp. JEL 0842]|nr:glucosyltransferase [Chytridiales sp. JEL 0842]
MDEVFHIPQAQRYCAGNFSYYDPKLTTPPGLYLTSIAIIKPFEWAFGDSVGCSPEILRVVNIVYYTLTIFTVSKLLQVIRGKNVTTSGLEPLIITLFPVSFFFNLMYYTDSGSTFFVLWGYLLGLKGQFSLSSLKVFLVAIAFRQTNAVWMVFTAGVVVLNILSDTKDKKTRGALVRVTKPGGKENLLQATYIFVNLVFKNMPYLMSKVWPYCMVLIAFASFIVWNGGIVLGDKSNHIPTKHFAQILYFTAFAVAFSLPHSHSVWTAVFSPLQFVSMFLKSKTRLFSSILILVCMAVIVQRFTVEHPFLLADNRHFTFYIWRWLFRKHPLIRYVIIPGYFICGVSLLAEFGKRQSSLWILMFVICTAATLVPSPLLEFRYFVIPFFLYRLHLAQPTTNALMWEAVLHILVNAVAFGLFVGKPFRWSHVPDEIQRFMF